MTHCDACGRGAELHVRHRANGDRLWLCAPCSSRAFGTMPPANVVADVASDRAKYGGGPRIVAAEVSR